ncbi:MAG: hypothetical protein JOZ18_07180 [Chloroflexi bacterium]|nr:hypothetical protein [Chloroflexota bacterium]
MQESNNSSHDQQGYDTPALSLPSETVIRESGSNSYDQQGYDAPSLPYMPDISGEQYVSQQPFVESVNSAYKNPVTPYPDFLSPTVPVNVPLDNLSTGEPSPEISGKVVPHKKRRLALWITLGSICAVLLIAGLSFFTYLYINRSTPVKTLDAFCAALQKEDYPTAYNAFSKNFQGKISEADFASLLSQDKVVLCTHGTADDSSNSATTSLKLVHDSKGVNDDIVTLTKDADANWKINDVKKAS